MTALLSFTLALLFGCKGLTAQWTGPKAPIKKEALKEIHYGPLTPAHRTDSAMEAFRDYGLGQFIHWGLYAIPGGEWEGVSAAKGAPASEWIRAWSGPTRPKDWKNIYDSLYKQFDPKDFDAKAWASKAKAMGVKYLIFTTKHHDGFALWPSRYSTYTVAQTPYKKDIVKQVVDAYTAQGIDVFLYFSVLEWNNPDYMVNVPSTADQKKRFNRFLDYTRNQLLELLARYPKIKGFWFDGTWDPSWKSAYAFTYQLEKELRERHPGLIIGSRFRNDEYGARHFDSNGNLLGDYEQGWERKLPGDYSWLNGHDWDAVMTIPPNGWGYLKDWKGIYAKTADDLLEMLMRCRSMNGNFVINFGPDAHAKMRPEEELIAQQIGQWLKQNGEAVYKPRHIDLPATKYGYYSGLDSVVYLSVFNRPVNHILRLSFDKKANLIPHSAHILGSTDSLRVQWAPLGLDLDKHTYYDIYLPQDFNPSKAFVVKIILGPKTNTATQLMDAQM